MCSSSKGLLNSNLDSVLLKSGIGGMSGTGDLESNASAAFEKTCEATRDATEPSNTRKPSKTRKPSNTRKPLTVKDVMLERLPSKNDLQKGDMSFRGGNYRSYASVVSAPLLPSGSLENHINRIKLNLSGQSVKDGIYYLKKHLIFGVYCGTLGHLHVNTGHDGSDLKQAVTDLLDDEGIKWDQEKDPGCVLITFDREKKELKFNKGGRNSGCFISID
ncbi:unnamed protein product [Lactuca virosa]|uniref:Uncharacterized protein n=1 Tax=Lactuca virosa TaxID=75947 RepID=A0AAU9LVJ5_9ASTR|nr:unnamed protein product [Lactuca virosa]